MINKIHIDSEPPWGIFGGGNGPGKGYSNGRGDSLERPLIVDETKGFGIGYGNGSGSGITYPWRGITIAEIGFPGEGTGFGTCSFLGKGK